MTAAELLQWGLATFTEKSGIAPYGEGFFTLDLEAENDLHQFLWAVLADAEPLRALRHEYGNVDPQSSIVHVRLLVV